MDLINIESLKDLIRQTVQEELAKSKPDNIAPNGAAPIKANPNPPVFDTLQPPAGAATATDNFLDTFKPTDAQPQISVPSGIPTTNIPLPVDKTQTTDMLISEPRPTMQPTPVAISPNPTLVAEPAPITATPTPTTNPATAPPVTNPITNTPTPTPPGTAQVDPNSQIPDMPIG